MTETRITHILLSYRPIGDYKPGIHGSVLILPGKDDPGPLILGRGRSRHESEGKMYRIASRRFEKLKKNNRHATNNYKTDT